MPSDTEFTLSLFDNTALSSWTDHARPTVADADEADRAIIYDAADDAEDDGDTPPPPADPIARGSNFRLAGTRELARGWPARARDNVTAIVLSKELEQSGRAPTPDEQARRP